MFFICIIFPVCDCDSILGLVLRKAVRSSQQWWLPFPMVPTVAGCCLCSLVCSLLLLNCDKSSECVCVCVSQWFTNGTVFFSSFFFYLCLLQVIVVVFFSNELRIRDRHSSAEESDWQSPMSVVLLPKQLPLHYAKYWLFPVLVWSESVRSQEVTWFW